MTLRSLALVAAALLSACALAIAGCDSGGHSGLYPVSVDGRWGYIDKTGGVVIPAQFDRADPFQDGLALVSVAGQQPFFIDGAGSVVPLPAGLYPLGGFSEGLAPVETAIHERGYVDKSGAVVVHPKLREALAYSDGLAPASSDGNMWGYIDRRGEWSVEPRFDEIGRFSRGLAPARQIFGTSSAKWGYIDAQGTYAIEQQFEFAWPFSEGLAAVALTENGTLESGYVDSDGRWVIELPVDVYVGEISEFHDGLALAEAVVDGSSAVMGRGWLLGYVNKRGEWAIEAKFVDALPFAEGLAAAAVYNEAFDPPPIYSLYDEEGDPQVLWGYVDKKGRWAIEPRYAGAQAFSGGVARVTVSETLSEKDPKTDLTCRLSDAYINTSGKVIWQAR
jgi:hypothetical protein